MDFPSKAIEETVRSAVLCRLETTVDMAWGEGQDAIDQAWEAYDSYVALFGGDQWSEKARAELFELQICVRTDVAFQIITREHERQLARGK